MRCISTYTCKWSPPSACFSTATIASFTGNLATNHCKYVSLFAVVCGYVRKYFLLLNIEGILPG
nr:hypothetical protein [Cressdnaviricota sp.]